MNLDKIFNIYKKHNLKGKSHFINRSNNKENLLIYLIGYKKELWNNVIDRLEKEIDNDIDICLVSSGKDIPEVRDLSEKKSWSYLFTKRNNVCLAENLAIAKFPNAKYIYKIDEDIFLTHGTLKKMKDTMLKADTESPFRIGASSPLLNINAYGYYRILEKTNSLDDYRKKFGPPKMISGQKSLIENSPELAKYLWGFESPIKKIDELNIEFEKSGLSWSICPIRLSIGCILYKREFWESFGGFPVIPGNGMGLDETILIGSGAAFSWALAVAENSVVGHFGYAKQWNEMLSFYKNNPEFFSDLLI